MAANKNQHFVPRCLLKPFTLDGAGSSIDLFNVNRQRVIRNAPVKNQCSADYFYGEDLRIEKALQGIEGSYATAMRDILMPGYVPSREHSQLLLRFWLLQHLRTEAASVRLAQISEDVQDIGKTPWDIKLSLRDAVFTALKAYGGVLEAISDLKTGLVLNRSARPFVTSDHPAILTNRWSIGRGYRGQGVGLGSAGAILMLPLSPTILFLAYDGDVYSLQSKGGWIVVKDESDVDAFNQHQFLNCRANIYFRAPDHDWLLRAFDSVQQNRPAAFHKVHYAVLESESHDSRIFRRVDRHDAQENEEALIHVEAITPEPTRWPKQIGRRASGFAYSDGSALGFVRRARAFFGSKASFSKVRL